MLRDVNINLLDGGVGAGEAAGIGLHMKIGVSPIESATPIIISADMNVKKIKEKLGNSPLADSCMDSISAGSRLIYCLPVKASTDGTISDITKTGTGKGIVTTSGKPNNSYDIKCIITGSGGLNKASMKYSINGGSSYSEELTLPVGGVVELDETGVTLTFKDDADTENSFIKDDVISLSTTSPQMTNQDVLTAVESLKYSPIEFEYIHIVGESEKALWAALAIEGEKYFSTYYKPLYFVVEARNIDSGESLDVYANSLIDEAKGLNSKFLQVVSARVEISRMDGTVRDINGAAIVCGLYSKSGVQESIGKTRSYPINALKLLPEGIENWVSALDDARFLTFREYVGIEGKYVTNARMMAQAGSDYRYAERVRVSNKLARATRRESLLQLQDEIDMSDLSGSLEAIKSFIQVPLDEMVKKKEISSGKIVIPTGQDILANEKLDLKIIYIPVGHIREMEIDMGMANPFTSN